MSLASSWKSSANSNYASSFRTQFDFATACGYHWGGCGVRCKFVSIADDKRLVFGISGKWIFSQNNRPHWKSIRSFLVTNFDRREFAFFSTNAKRKLPKFTSVCDSIYGLCLCVIASCGTKEIIEPLTPSRGSNDVQNLSHCFPFFHAPFLSNLIISRSFFRCFSSFSAAAQNRRDPVNFTRKNLPI